MVRISSVLRDYLQSAKPGDLVDVVLEMAGSKADAAALPAERGERYAAIGQQFTSANKAALQLIQDAGGEVLDSSWLSSAIKARIPVEGISQLLSLDHIESIDLPRRLKRD